jgi:hypothetical protein
VPHEDLASGARVGRSAPASSGAGLAPSALGSAPAQSSASCRPEGPTGTAVGPVPELPPRGWSRVDHQRRRRGRGYEPALGSRKRARRINLAHRDDGLFEALCAWLEDGMMAGESGAAIVQAVDDFAVSHSTLWARYCGVLPRPSAVPARVRAAFTEEASPGPRRSGRSRRPPSEFWLAQQHGGSRLVSGAGSVSS